MMLPRAAAGLCLAISTAISMLFVDALTISARAESSPAAKSAQPPPVRKNDQLQMRGRRSDDADMMRLQQRNEQKKQLEQTISNTMKQQKDTTSGVLRSLK